MILKTIVTSIAAATADFEPDPERGGLTRAFGCEDIETAYGVTGCVIGEQDYSYNVVEARPVVEVDGQRIDLPGDLARLDDYIALVGRLRGELAALVSDPQAHPRALT